jgi:hypothetical protein
VRDERVRPDQDSFDPTEHGCVCRDPECEAKHREDRKSGIAQEHPKTEAKIVEQRLHSFASRKRLSFLCGHTVLDDATVEQVHGTICVLSETFVVRDHANGRTALM